MIATEQRRAAGLSFVLLCALAPGACVQASADEARPETDLEDSSSQCAGNDGDSGRRCAELCPQTPAGACDPRCVDGGRYRVTADVVDDTKSEDRLWQRRVSVRLTQPEAVAYCADLTLDGLGGWRLPSPIELNGIRYKPGGLFGGGTSRHYCIPSVDQAAFPETPAGQFWTSRANADDTAWYVGFDDGRMHRDTRTSELWVRCVHDPVAKP